MSTGVVITAMCKSELKSQGLTQRECQSVRGWIHRLTLFFFFVKTAFIFQEQRSGSGSFRRTQVKTISLIMVKNEIQEKAF